MYQEGASSVLTLSIAIVVAPKLRLDELVNSSVDVNAGKLNFLEAF